MRRDVMADEDKFRRKGVGFGDDIQSRIGSQLKSIYDSVLDEPVPDRISMLMKQLEEAHPADATPADIRQEHDQDG